MSEADAQSDLRTLQRDLATFARPATGRSLFELAVTVLPFLGLLAGMWASLWAGYWAGLLLALPAGAMLTRLFMIQHDCGHGAFFKHRRANDWTGRAISVFTFTPYDYFKRSHALHHATTGNLDRRGMGDVSTLTAAEYRALPRGKRIFYRMYRHPLVMFGLGPAFLFLLQFRLPIGLMGKGWRPWISTMTTNLVIAVAIFAVIWFLGWMTFVVLYLPVLVVAATIGVWLFYVQHQFDGAHWDREGDWDFHQAALHGSSHYALPTVLRWVSANIGIHHIHHLSSRIPFYRLPRVLRARPELQQVSRLTLRQSLRSVRLKLWCETSRRLVTFREAKAAA
jgi:omega-6 fatty acid desaturase (delta-12 desaturase)